MDVQEAVGRRHIDICTCIQLSGSGLWHYNDGAQHMSSELVAESKRRVHELGYNLTLNVGPRPDGSLHPDDVEALVRSGVGG